MSTQWQRNEVRTSRSRRCLWSEATNADAGISHEVHKLLRQGTQDTAHQPPAGGDQQYLPAPPMAIIPITVHRVIHSLASRDGRFRG